MEQFKLKSIDELDLDFVQQREAAAAPSEAPVQSSASSLIPEISKDEPAVQEPVHKYFKKTADQFDDEAIFSPAAGTDETVHPFASYSPVGAPAEEDSEPESYGEVSVEKTAKAKKPAGKGNLIGRIASIVMLCITVAVFVFGCVISIFINNNGIDLAGLCFNSMYQSFDEIGVSKGDLVISKKLEASEYQLNSAVAVPAPNGQAGCDIQYITAITPTYDGCELTTGGISGGINVTNTYSSSVCYGSVAFFIPFFGGLITFAMDNAIFVCAFFVLLSALWCLLLIMLEKSSKASSKPKK